MVMSENHKPLMDLDDRCDFTFKKSVYLEIILKSKIAYFIETAK